MENNLKLRSLLPEVSTEFRMLKNNIFMLLGNKESSKSIMVASSIHQEGTSTIAKNLSLVSAEDPKVKVLLMDLNFRSPLKESIRGETKGLSDWFLENGFPLKSILHQTTVQNLYFLLPGNAKSDPLRMQESIRFSELLNELKEDFSCIVIDSSPLQYYPESNLLATKVDGVLLVVQAEKTRREIVIDTKTKLNSIHANLLGVVLNRKKYYIPKIIYNLL